MIYLRIVLLYLIAIPVFFWEFLMEQRHAVTMAYLSSFEVANDMARKRLKQSK